MLRKAFLSLVALTLFILPLNAETLASVNRWDTGDTFEVASDTLTVYNQPNIDSEPQFTLYKGMDIEPS
ncbi:MAG: hypothetical protein ABIG80_04530, partial [Patescibacteria group bacterium]